MNQENEKQNTPETVYTRRGALKRIAALGLMAAAPSMLISTGRTTLAALDITDTWNATETFAGQVSCYSFSIQQSGQALKVKTPDGDFTGTINGNTISWTGAFTDTKTNETVTINSMNLQLSTDGNILNGSYSWTRSGGATGTTTLLSVRQPPGLPAGYSSTYASCYTSIYPSNYSSLYPSGYYSTYPSFIGSFHYYSYSSYVTIQYPSKYTSGSTC